VDEDRQWFKSKQGLEVCETGRDISFCGHTILEDQWLVVQDALEDERFCDNPLVTGEPHIRFYAGYPLTAPDGSKLGSLCIIDTNVRIFSAEDMRTLATLGETIESELVALNLATNDALTGLSNLRGFLEIGRHTLAICRRFGHALQLLYVKVGRVNEIYMRHGIEQAERVLVEVGQLLTSSFRESDLVSRVGDDEFAVLMSRGELAEKNPGLERLEAILERINQDRARELHVCAKAAVVTFVPARHSSLEDLLAEAELRVRPRARTGETTAGADSAGVGSL
jgi:diguanylate cyclase (GGDEF)-like protein